MPPAQTALVDLVSLPLVVHPLLPQFFNPLLRVVATVQQLVDLNLGLVVFDVVLAVDVGELGQHAHSLAARIVAVEDEVALLGGQGLQVFQAAQLHCEQLLCLECLLAALASHAFVRHQAF